MQEALWRLSCPSSCLHVMSSIFCEGSLRVVGDFLLSDSSLTSNKRKPFLFCILGCPYPELLEALPETRLRLPHCSAWAV